MQISELCQWLRSRTNHEKRPYQEETITAYRVAARALDAWMTAAGMDGDFTACDAGILNRFFRDYHAGHHQNGTNTKQRNLRHLFTWLEATYDHPHPYTDDLNRYAPVKMKPSSLSIDFITDLLEVTGGGRGKSFPDAWDHALIRVTTGAPPRQAQSPRVRGLGLASAGCTSSATTASAVRGAATANRRSSVDAPTSTTSPPDHAQDTPNRAAASAPCQRRFSCRP